MSYDFVLRIVGMIVFAVFSGYWGFGLAAQMLQN